MATRRISFFPVLLLAISAALLALTVAAGLDAPTTVVHAGPPCSAPANDDFESSSVITSLPFSDSLSNECATLQVGEPDCHSPENTVWYTFTPTSSQVVTATATGLDFVFAVYTGDSVDALSGLDPAICLADISPYVEPMIVKFAVHAGQTYHMQVGGGYPFGTGDLDFALESSSFAPGVDFSLGIDLDGDTTDDCTTGAGGPKTCNAQPNQALQLKLYLDALPEGLDFYEGFSATVRHAGVTSKQSVDPSPWPQCGLPASAFQPDYDNVACATLGSSTYLGLIATYEFTCTNAGTLKLVHGSGWTYLLRNFVSFFEPGIDQLNISCSTVVPPVAGLAFDTDSGGTASGSWWWLTAIAGGVIVTLIGAALFARERS